MNEIAISGWRPESRTSILRWKIALAACMPIGSVVNSYLPSVKLTAVYFREVIDTGICQKAEFMSMLEKYLLVDKASVQTRTDLRL